MRRAGICTLISTTLGATRLTIPAKLEGSSSWRFTDWPSRFRAKSEAVGGAALTAAKTPVAMSKAKALRMVGRKSEDWEMGFICSAQESHSPLSPASPENDKNVILPSSCGALLTTRFPICRKKDGFHGYDFNAMFARADVCMVARVDPNAQKRLERVQPVAASVSRSGLGRLAWSGSA